MKTARTATLVALAALACQQDREQQESPPALPSLIRDSAGIRIAENPRPPEGSRLPWRIGPEPTLSIGELEGEEPYMLHGVLDAARLSDGRIVVANQGSSEVRMFDASGNHLVSWGGEGEGPGEFASLLHVAPWPGDSIVAWYSRGLGISVFDAEGSFGRSFVLRSGVAESWRSPRPIGVRAGGTILSINDPEGADTAVVDIWDADGALYASLGTHPHREVIVTTDERGYQELDLPAYGRELVTGQWGDLVVASHTTRYEIRAFRDDGALARIVRREHVPRATTEADREAYVEGELAKVEEQLARAAAIPGLEGMEIRAHLSSFRGEEGRKLFGSTPLAATFPAFSTILSDASGNLWVREYDFPREERPAPLWTVFDPDGRVLGFIETPVGLRIGQIGEDYILGHYHDELEVEYVQVWPLERPGG
ncbi:MAG: hypothetical protein OXQ93_03510 [Gemmatimonadota bacterium]|nr:hypothetical protein [bacterium]MDE2874483.1 hypothetical protein [Gemmatimonadota bacterium]